MSEEIEYKSWYLGIFSLNYLFQGVTVGVFSVIVPIYILIMLASAGVVITASDIAMIASIILLPWAIKLFFGMLADRYGTKKFGRRRPWIIIPIIMAGLLWIIIPLFITAQNAIVLFLIFGLLINTGVAFSDTATDGLILDIVPKEKLGSVQGTCWGFRSVGQIAGGPVLAYLVVSIGTSVETIFIACGVLMIIVSFTTIVIKEPLDYPEVHIKEHFKKMVNNGKDWKVYIFALFNAIIDGVAVLFLSIYLLIQMGLISSEGVSLDLETTNLNLYVFQANINLIISVGIIIGAVAGGLVSDKIQRRLSVYISYGLATTSFLLMIVSTNVTFLLIVSSLIGASMGWRHSSYSAVAGEMSKQHPELTSTYLSLCNSFSNLGASLGLALTAILLNITGSYIFIFVFLGLIQNLGIIPFLSLDHEEFEIEKVLLKTKTEKIRS